jgi:hypothetical protein
MRSIFKGLLAAAALAALAGAPARATTLVDGGGWSTFLFQGAGSSFQDANGDAVGFSFTLTHPDTFRITDGFFDGDQFDVAVFDVSTFTNINFETSTPTFDGAYVGDCWDCAFFDPNYNTLFSNGSVLLGPGTYDVTGFATQSPFGAGEAAVSLGAVPEPATWAMMLAGFFGLGEAMRVSRRRQRAATATA